MEWLKKNWPAVATLGLSVLFSFLLGRFSVRRTDTGGSEARGQLDQLREQLAAERAAVEQLVGALESERIRVEQLEGKHATALRELEQLRDRAAGLEVELTEAERTLRIAEQYHADTGADIDSVGKLTGGLRAILERHRAELEKIQVSQPDPDRGDGG
jgi:chromosome segregation ATPase